MYVFYRLPSHVDFRKKCSNIRNSPKFIQNATCSWLFEFLFFTIILVYNARDCTKSEDYTMTVGERIKDLRKKKGYSQEKLATHLNMSRQAVAKWEQNGCEPNFDCLTSMAKLFDVDLDYLITGKVSEEKAEDVINKKEAIIIKERDHLLDKKDIILLITFIISTVAFIGLFIYALLNPLYWNQRYSFLWWYIRFWVSSGTWFRILVLISTFGIVFSLFVFLRRRQTIKTTKNEKKEKCKK
jgi:transcriptional regulator with XRE-family HTH domain